MAETTTTPDVSSQEELPTSAAAIYFTLIPSRGNWLRRLTATLRGAVPLRRGTPGSCGRPGPRVSSRDQLRRSPYSEDTFYS